MTVGTAAKWLWAIFMFGCFSAGAGTYARAQPLLLERLPHVANNQVRLVMVATRGCPFCLKFERDIAPDYSASKEGQVAPLVRVRIGSEALSKIAPVTVTPTFLVLQGEEELGRFTGYPGIEGFWIELNDILKEHQLLPSGQPGAQP